MTDTLYQITDWDKNFENNRTRKLRALRYTLSPTRFGAGYSEMLRGRAGAARFGAWCATCKVAATSPPPRGKLIQGNGQPHTPKTLARFTRIPESTIIGMIERALEVGWLEVVASPVDVQGVTPPSPERQQVNPLCATGPEGTGPDRTGLLTPTPCEVSTISFREIWFAYPPHRQTDHDGANRLYSDAVRDGIDPELILAKVQAYAESPQGKSRFARGITKWLAAPGWMEDPAAWQDDGSNSNGTPLRDLNAEADAFDKDAWRKEQPK